MVKKHFRSNNDPCRPHLGRMKLDTKKIYFSVTSSPKISSNLLRRMFASDTGNLQNISQLKHFELFTIIQIQYLRNPTSEFLIQT